MPKMLSVKTVKLGTACVAAASMLSASALALNLDQNNLTVPPAIEVTAPIVIENSHIDDATKSMPASQKLGLLAIGAAALAGLVRLIGARKLAAAVTQGAVGAAKFTVKTGVKAAKLVGATFASPLRFAGVMAGLALFALTGIGFYDVEWIFGLMVGALLMGGSAYGVARTRKAFAFARRPTSTKTP